MTASASDGPGASNFKLLEVTKVTVASSGRRSSTQASGQAATVTVTVTVRSRSSRSRPWLAAVKGLQHRLSARRLTRSAAAAVIPADTVVAGIYSRGD